MHIDMYGMMYGMKKTTVYIGDELKASLERVAAAEGCSEAELIRRGILEVTEKSTRPKPRLGPFSSGDPTLAERVDEELEGFGE